MEILLHSLLLVFACGVAILSYTLARIYHIGVIKFYMKYITPGTYTYTEYLRLIKIMKVLAAVCVGFTWLFIKLEYRYV